jgi:hypothetical protein
MPREDDPQSARPAPHGALYRLVGKYLPDLIYGANDGIITTLAVVSGVTGAALSSTVILILGFANLVADGFSMGASNVLSRPSSASSSQASFRCSPTCCPGSRARGSRRPRHWPS